MSSRTRSYSKVKYKKLDELVLDNKIKNEKMAILAADKEEVIGTHDNASDHSKERSL